MDDEPANLEAIKDEPQYRVADTIFRDVILKGLIEPPAEYAKAKREEDAKAAEYKRRERFVILLFALGLVFLFFVFCIYLYVKGSVDDKKWALAALASTITWILTYTFGHRIG